MSIPNQLLIVTRRSDRDWFRLAKTKTTKRIPKLQSVQSAQNKFLKFSSQSSRTWLLITWSRPTCPVFSAQYRCKIKHFNWHLLGAPWMARIQLASTKVKWGNWGQQYMNGGQEDSQQMMGMEPYGARPNRPINKGTVRNILSFPGDKRSERFKKFCNIY